MNTNVRTVMALFVAMLVMMLARPAAADLTEVTLGDFGPDKELPIGTSYYLAGTAKKGVTSVQPVFVRTHTTWLLGGSGPACAEVKSHLGKFVGKQGPSDAIGQLTPGIGRAGDIWHGADPQFDPSMVTYAPPAWRRTGDANVEAPYKILVPGDDEFFGHGDRYCLFVYVTSPQASEVGGKLQKALEDWVTAIRECGTSASPEAFKTCATTALVARTKAIADAQQDISAADKERLDDAVSAAGEIFDRLERSRDSLDRLLLTWSRPGSTAPAPGFTQPLVSGTTLEVGVDPLANAILGLLLRSGAVFAYVDANRKTAFRSLGGIDVHFVEVLGDFDTIVVLANRSSDPKAREKLEVKASGLKLPSSDATLRDLFEALRGNVRVGGSYVRVADLQTTVARWKGHFDAAVAEDDRTRFDAASASTQAVARAIERALGATAVEPLGTEGGVAHELGAWLGPRVVPCRDAELQTWIPRASCKPAAITVPATPTGCTEYVPMEGPWKGYFGLVCKNGSPPTAENPFEFVVRAWTDHRDARKAWVDAIATLQTTVDKTKAIGGSPIAIAMHLSQDQWVFSYVTPITGFGFVLRGEDTFALPYFAVQIHAVPNLVDDPQWSHQSRDWARAFALELGVSSTVSAFGPGGRFSGYGGLPPLFIGLAFHLIPYTSFSIGGVVLGRRASTLNEENPSPFLGVYAGVNVQINIPDIVLALKGRHTLTAADPKK